MKLRSELACASESWPPRSIGSPVRGDCRCEEGSRDSERGNACSANRAGRLAEQSHHPRWLDEVAAEEKEDGK